MRRIVLLSFLILLPTASLSRADEPSAKGLAELIDARNSNDDKVRAAVRESLQAIGSDTVPVMAWAVEHLKRREQEPAETQGKIVDALSKLGLAAVPVMLDAVSADYTSQRRANVASGEGYQTSTRLREVVSRVLAKQPDVVPIVLAMLRDERDAVRAVAASTCGGLKDKAKPALPPLIEALHDPVGDVRLQALGAVVILSASEPSASEALCAVLRRHKDPGLRLSAMSLISSDAKSHSEPVFAAVRDALDDPQVEIRVGAAELLMRTSQHRPLAEAAILRECSAREYSWRQRALSVIRQQGLSDKAASLDVATRMLNDDSFAVRLEAVESVNALKQVDGSKPRLIEMLSDDEPRVRSRVASLLWDAGEQTRAMRTWLAILQAPGFSDNYEIQQRLRQLTNIPADVEPILIEGLAASNSGARSLVLEILSRRPKLSESALLAIQRLTKDKDQSVRASAIRALQIIRVPIDVQLKLLQESLADVDVNVRQQAAQRLAELGKAAQPARPKLLEMLQDDKESAPLETTIVMALTRQGGEQRLLLPAFTRLLKSSDQSLVTITLSSLGQMGPDAVPIVLPLTNDPNSQTQLVALSTLVTLASQNSQVAPQVLPLLLKKMREAEPTQRPILAGYFQRLGAASVKPLAADLRHPDVSMRRLVAETLRDIGSRGAQQAEPELIAALDDPDLQVRLNCAVTLTQVAKPEPQRITAVLLEGLRDNDLAHRRLTVRIGFPDRYSSPELLSELEKVLADEDIEVVVGAARCLLAHQKTEPVTKQVRHLAAAFGTHIEIDMALANVFTSLGPRAKEAIPDLVEKIKQERSYNVQWVNSSLARIGPAAIPALTVVAVEGSEVQQQRVVSVLQNLGSEGVSAIVELHGSVAPNVRNNILFVLSSKLDQSPAALKLLLTQIESADPATVMVALSALSNAPSLPREAVDPLRRLLNEARQAAATSPLRSRLTLLMQALSRIGPDAHEAIPDLTVLLTEAEPAIPCFAAAAILSIDPSHTDAGNVLIQCLDTPATQNIAVHALFKLGLRAQRLVPQLEKYVESSTLPSRGRLVYLLTVCGSQSDSLVSATEELLDSPNNDDRQYAAQTLRWLGPRAQHLLPKLLGHLTAPQDYARFYIVLALPFVAPDAKEVVTVLADLARNDPNLRMPTLISLAELKDKACSATELIAPLLNADLTYHTLAATTLVLIDSESHPLAGPMLLELFEKPDNPTNPVLVQANSLIADAVTLVAKDSDEARSQIRKGLTHDSFKVRICVARAPWKVEGQASAVVPVLLEALDANDATIYSINDVAGTLGEIGPPAKAAVPTLLRKARSASIDQQSRVVNALKAIDPAAATAEGYR